MNQLPAKGSPAPDFALRAPDGRTVHLADFRGKNVVLFFYPKDGTPGCTIEACAFRDQYEQFVEAGAEIVGISSDHSESHLRFAERHKLPMLLLSDPGGVTRKKYGVGSFLGLLSERVTFLVDAGGVIRHVVKENIRVSRHISESLAQLRALGGNPDTRSR
jgi:peroxiredoxin Q/BCP